MKYTLLTAFAGLASASAALRGSTSADVSSDTIVYASPTRSHEGQSTKELWDELAAEAAFMQKMVELGRSEEECKEDCNTAKDANPDFNRGRCQTDCESIDDDNRSPEGSCRECYNQFSSGSSALDRCLESCEAGNDQRCEDADTCNDCDTYCSSKSQREACYEDVEDMKNVHCGGDDISDKDINENCDNPNNCNACKKQCTDSDIKEACKDKYCSDEDFVGFKYAMEKRL